MRKELWFSYLAQVAAALALVAVHYVSELLEGDMSWAGGYEVQLGWVPAVMAGISALGSLAGGWLGNKQARKQRRALEAKQRRLDAWRDAALNSDYLSRADSQAALRTVRENIDEQLKEVDTSAIKSGMTDEARAAYASRLNRGYADAVSQIAGLGEKYRDRVRDIYVQQSNAIEDAKMGIGSTTGAQNLVNSIASAAGTFASLAGASAGRGATTAGTSVQPSDTVQQMANSGYLPNNRFLSDKYKINL